jgi:3-oxoadipate enol-lactonase
MIHESSDNLSMATTRDGAKIAYRKLDGAGKGRIALIHSLAMDNSFWNRTAQYLAKAGEVLLFDCRGHGASSKSDGPYTIELFADDLADLLNVVGWDTTSVAGASMGGSVALAFAAAYPKRVQGLGLVDTTAWYGAKAPEQWEERARKAVENGMASLVNFQKSRWFSAEFSQANPQIVEDSVVVFLANQLSCYVETCRMLGRFDKRAALPLFNFPARIIVGSDDYATPPEMAEMMQKSIPGATLRVLEGAAHLTPIECPEIVAEELRQIMNTSPSGVE